MKQLPNKFQMRVSHLPSFTHSVSKNANGDYEVNWARGYPNKIRSVPRKTFEDWDAVRMVESGSWIIVDDKPKQEETKLPDEWVSEKPPAQIPSQFYFEHKNGHDAGSVCLTRDGRVWNVLWGGRKEAGYYSYGWIPAFVEKGVWKVIDKKPLTAEQQRQLKEFLEHVAQLSQSIKLNEQDVAHKMMLIGSYKARQDDLLDKIAEINGEELPSITKAKGIRAELDKLKGSV